MVPGSGAYRSDVSFRLFDCLVIGKSGKWWLERDSLENIARKLGIKCVPIIGYIIGLPINASDIESIFGKNYRSSVGSHSIVAAEECGDINVRPEGIVARSEPLLFNRKGDRVIWKLKIKDF